MAASPRLEHPLILHHEPELFLELINATAGNLNIPAVYVEKDYWVTLVLKRLHESEFKADIVFKGGTALSKAHRLIDRFSEDIDLAARANDLGDSRRKRLIKNTEAAITQDLTYQEAHDMESKGSRFRKTAHAFPAQTDASQLGQVSDIILVEINAFADPEPAQFMDIETLIHDVLKNSGRQDLIDQYELTSFDVLVLSVERTLCEKIMGLVRAGYEDDATADFKRRIRHFHDIAMILRQERYQVFVAGDDFPKMVDAVRNSDRESMPGAEVWLDPPITDAPIFVDTKKLWDKIQSEFHGTFEDMVYGDSIPDDVEILAAIQTIKTAITRISAPPANDSTPS